MVTALETRQLSLVPCRIPFQARDSLLDGAAEPKANFKLLLILSVRNHKGSLAVVPRWKYDSFYIRLKFFRPVPILAKRRVSHQITALCCGSILQ